jgi:hypothetical protein
MVVLCVRSALNDPVISELAQATQHSIEVHSYPYEPRATLPLPFHGTIQVPTTASRVQEWIPEKWWYLPPDKNAPFGPVLWDQMLGWYLQGWLRPDSRVKPGGFSFFYPLRDLFPGEAAFVVEPASQPLEAAPAQLVLQTGTVAPDVVAEFRAALQKADYDLRRIPYVACKRGAVGVTGWVLAIGADANEEEEDKSCPAHAASGHGHPQVLPILAAHGASLDKADMDGWTPAHIASANGNGQVLWVLAALGADMNAVNEYNGLSVANVWNMPLP